MGRVVVAGAVNMDLIGLAERLPRQSETVLGTAFRLVPGGKGANQAVAARRCGAPTTLVGSIGRDAFGEQLATFLAGEGLDLRLARRGHSSTGVALVLVGARGENAILVVPGANDENEVAQVEALPLDPGDVVLLQGEISDEVNEALLRRANARGCTTVLNPAPFRPSLLSPAGYVDHLVVNELELAQMCEESDGDGSVDSAAELLDRAVAKDGAGKNAAGRNVVVTLGARGLLAHHAGTVSRVPGHPVPVVDTTGAGDCFCGAFAASLAIGRPVAAALVFANAAAALSVTAVGAAASMPRHADVAAFLATVPDPEPG